EDMKVRNLSPRTQRCWCTRWPNSPSTSIDRLTGWGWRKFAPIKSTSTQLGQVQRRGLRSPLLLRRHPQAHRDEPALGQQFLDIAVAQGEPEIEPDRVLDVAIAVQVKGRLCAGGCCLLEQHDTVRGL